MAAKFLSGKHVLVVEDEAIVAMQLEYELQQYGATVVGPAYDLNGACRLAEERIDVAILDINLRGEKVFPAARRLHERGVPFAFVSANCGDSVEAGLDSVAAACFDKPLAVAELLAWLKQEFGG